MTLSLQRFAVSHPGVGLEPPLATLLAHIAGMRAAEMRREDQRALPDEILDQPLARLDRQTEILAGSGVEVGMEEFERVVEGVAGKPGVLARRAEIYGHVAHGVAVGQFGLHARRDRGGGDR